jgi:aspartate carbamoyltransferase regulatory subunit
MNNKQLSVAALCDGTVIDHLPSDKLFKVISILKLDQTDCQITFGVNLESRQLGTKGLIKVANKFFEQNEINKITLIAPNASLNVIRNYQVAEKRALELPDEVTDIIACSNPVCISNNEPMRSRFSVIDKEDLKLRCHYCERVMHQKDLKLK